MSFFVSDSLKDLISESDLKVEGPIVFVEEKQNLEIKFSTAEYSVETQLLKIKTKNNKDRVFLVADNTILDKIFQAHNTKVTYCIKLNDNEYMHDAGIFNISSVQTVTDENNILFKIDIFKKELTDV